MGKKLAQWLAATEILIVSGAVLVSIIRPQFLLAAIGIAAFFWLIRWAAQDRPSIQTPADWAIILLILTIPATMWATTLPDETRTQVYRLLTGIALYYAIANWGASPSRLNLLISGLLVASLSLALLATIGVEWTISKLAFIPNEFYQLFSLFIADTIHPNVLAGNLIILMPFTFSVVFFNWQISGWVHRILATLTLISTTSILLLSQSRGALLAFGVSLALLFVLRWRWGWVFILTAAIILVVFIFTSGANNFLDIIETSGQNIKSLGQRREIWSRSIYMIQDFPFTGIGMGTFSLVADRLYPFFISSPVNMVHSHNLLLQIAVDLGLPGLIAWLGIFITIVMLSWSIFRLGTQTEQPALTAIGAGLLASQLALITHGLLDSVTWGVVRPAPIVWAIWGIAIAASRIQTVPDSQNNSTL